MFIKKNFELILYIFIFLIFFQVIKNNVDSTYISQGLSNQMQSLHSETLIQNYDRNFYYNNRSCNISNDKDDLYEQRKKVRWVYQKLISNIYSFTSKYSHNSPYYLNIFMLAFFMTGSYYFLINTVGNNWKNNFLFFAPTFFILSFFLSETFFSFFEFFLISIAIYLSFKKKYFLFLIIISIAILNRESGILISLCWLIFNKNIKKVLYSVFISLFVLYIFNTDLINCLFNVKLYFSYFFTENNTILPAFDMITSIRFLRELIFNYLIFLIVSLILFYRYGKSNKITLYIIIIYFIMFALGTPLNHMSVKLLIIPYFLVISNNFKNNQFYNSKNNDNRLN